MFIIYEGYSDGTEVYCNMRWGIIVVMDRGFIKSGKHDFLFDATYQSCIIGVILVGDRLMLAVDS